MKAPIQRMPFRATPQLSGIPVLRLAALLLASLTLQAFGAKQPNILWLCAEDISPHFGCYGDPHAITPHVDTLASQGVRYSHAFTTAGVCAPSRSAIITGMYQTTLGTQHMRGNARLPDSVKPFPTYLRNAGYYCSNNGKEDYQFKTPTSTWDDSSAKAHWRKRPDKEQPFFAVFNFTGCHESGIANEGKYKSVTAKLTPEQRQDAKALTTLPPYYPDTPVVREAWKRNYELITAMDAWAGNLIDQLKKDGLYEDTIIFFWSDHGIGLPRAKRWLYDSGTRVPLVIRIPEKFREKDQAAPNTVSDRLVSGIDFGPTVLNLAGLDIPGTMQGEPFLGPDLPAAREYVFGARDRMDERYDIIRMVRDHRFKYIRNYEPLKPYYQFMNSAETGATMKELRKGHLAGTLPPAAEYYFSPTKPVEELYDTETDPHEINNLAENPRYREILLRLRKTHLEWVKETRDTGLIAEPILVAREKEIGNRYEILRQTKDETLPARLSQTADAASSGPDHLPELLKALADRDAAVRYWGATGIGNIGPSAKKALPQIRERLKDDSPVVRIAAARALARLGLPQEALPTLTQELDKGEQWERLHAAIVLDEMDEEARPVLEEMRKALTPRKGLYANGKYVVRVINRALNQLEGTSNRVP
ncbi:sulfatase-like hydrolase/transferase [Haloferula chungangensis]|uniref:Sulfatase-like hydrolase/transferase n=1 Tax=Haloferula chungangensis TaxID=1048331 RepID=A0ABW2L427_9BACT